MRPALTGRALVLGAVVVLLVVVLAAPVQRYLASRNAVTAAQRRLAHDRAELRRLEAAKQRYADPGYLAEQARARLQYAMPGDTVYIVVGAHHRSAATVARSRPVATDPAWNKRLWNSIAAAAR